MKTVFTPNATSKLIVEDTVKLIKKKVDALDLGCGDVTMAETLAERDLMIKMTKLYYR